MSGLNSCTDLLVLEWLSQNNIPKEQVEFVVMPDERQEQALSQGLVDLAVLCHMSYIERPLPVFSQAQYYLGYRGVFEVARRAAKVLENTAFQQNLFKNTCLPYKKEWFAKSPFAYILS